MSFDKMTEETNHSKGYKLCSQCNQKPRYYSDGLCLKCYNRKRYLDLKICVDCNELKPHKQDGKCDRCFRLWRCEQAPKKLCECKCGEWIPSITQNGKPARFKKGHSQRGVNNSFYGKRHSDEVIDRFKRRTHSAVKKKHTTIERILEEELNNANVYFIIQKIFDIRDTIHPVDFFIPPNICIETDGEFWHTMLIHNETKTININRDYIVDYELEKQGYKVMRFWGTDIINNLKWVMNQIFMVIGKNYQINEWIYCACGCGQQLKRYDRWGRKRRFIQHHKIRINESERICVDCGSSVTDVNKKGSPIWYRHSDGYVCRKCYYKYGYKKWRENNPLKGRHKDMSDRYCKLCNSKKTSLKWDKKRGKSYPAWFRYENGWVCRRCKDKAKKIINRKLSLIL